MSYEGAGLVSLGVVVNTVVHTFTLHRLDCFAFKRTVSANQLGPFNTVAEARQASKQHPERGCILYGRCCCNDPDRYCLC